MFVLGWWSRLLEQKYAKECGGNWQQVDTETSAVLLAIAGVPLMFSTEAASPFRMVSANFTALVGNGEFLENGVKFEDVSKAIRSLKAPPVPRWESPKEEPISADPFRSVVSLTGLGPLCEALLGRLPWTDLGVIEERDELLGMEGDALKKHLEKFDKCLRDRSRHCLRHSLQILDPPEIKRGGGCIT